MIKHRKLIICILLSYALFIVGIFNVKAMVYSTDVTYYTRTGTPMGYPNKKTTLLGHSDSTDMAVLTWNFDSQYVVSCETDTCLIVIPYTAIWENDKSSGGSSYTYSIITNGSFTAQVGGPGYFNVCTTQDNNLECVTPNNTILSSLDIIISRKNLTSQSLNMFTFQTLGFWLIYNIGQNTQAIQETADNTKGINDSINDSSIDSNNTSSSTTSWGNKNASNGTITNLLTLPISLLQAIVNGIQSSCSSFSLGSLFGTNITLPCINVGNLIGSGLWSTIDILFSGFMILAIAKKLIKIFNDFTNLKTNQVDELYGGGK